MNDKDMWLRLNEIDLQIDDLKNQLSFALSICEYNPEVGIVIEDYPDKELDYKEFDDVIHNSINELNIERDWLISQLE